VLTLVSLAFEGWRRLSFKFVYHRELLLQNFVMHVYISKRFYAWRWIARSNASMKKLMRRYWRRRHRHYFTKWKYETRWRRTKEAVYPVVFNAFMANMMKHRRIVLKWAQLRMGFATVFIYRAFLRFKLRRLFWAIKLINRNIKKKYDLKLVAWRKLREKSRAAAEQETCNILLRRSASCLEDLVNGSRGDVIIGQYLNSVKAVIKQVEGAPPGSLLSTAKIFPDPHDAPEFAKLWTVRAKAMEVLKRRCQYTVTEASVRRFRLTYPPLYECDQCSANFILKGEYAHHRNYECTGVTVLKDFTSRSKAAAVAAGVNHKATGSTEQTMTERGKSIALAVQRSIEASKTALGNKIKSECETPDKTTMETDSFSPLQSCVCWSLAEPIVAAALRPIAVYLE
jgi:hypothetical protein